MPSGLVRVPGLDLVVSVFDYDDVIGPVILAAKNQGRRDLLRRFGRVVGSELQKPETQGLLSQMAPEVVTWVPASPANRRQRGFEHGRVLAGTVAKTQGLPLRRLLSRHGASQKGRGRAERLTNLELWPVGSVPATVLLVDDVVTTGASLGYSAAALRAGGAHTVVGVTIASTGWSAPGRK